MFKTVIVGVDAIGSGREVVAAALAIAPGASLTLVHAYPAPAPGSPPASARDQGYYAELRDEALALLRVRRSENLVPQAEIAAIPDTSPARGLKRYASEHPVDLIILGPAHRSAVGRLVLGDVCHGVLHGAPCPVLVPPRGLAAGTAPPARIAVAYDGSPEASQALDLATGIARQSGGRLDIVQAIEVPFAPQAWGAEVAGYVLSMIRPAEERLESLAGSLDVPAGCRVVEGSTKTVLKDAAEQADLIVCGSRGWGPGARLSFGSVAEHLMHNAPCPVLVAPRPASG